MYQYPGAALCSGEGTRPDPARVRSDENGATSMRLRPAVIAGALLILSALGLATPAHAAAAANQVPTSTAVSMPAAGPLADPGPECTGQSGGCWEYYDWYWTYSSCHDEGRTQLRNNPGRYDNYNCAGGHGLVVWLWLHRP